MNKIVIIALIILAITIALGTFATFISQNSGELFTVMLILHCMELAMILRLSHESRN